MTVWVGVKIMDYLILPALTIVISSGGQVDNFINRIIKGFEPLFIAVFFNSEKSLIVFLKLFKLCPFDYGYTITTIMA